jgi:hypothetical protein
MMFIDENSPHDPHSSIDGPGMGSLHARKAGKIIKPS